MLFHVFLLRVLESIVILAICGLDFCIKKEKTKGTVVSAFTNLASLQALQLCLQMNFFGS
jgi:hypothetical protein